MFTSTGAENYDTTLFGGVYFSSISDSSGALTVEVGVGNWLPLAAIALALTAFYLLTYVIYRVLRVYKNDLSRSTS